MSGPLDIISRMERAAASGGRAASAASDWLDRFAEYNASVAGSLAVLAEQPQDIQGREEQIAILHAVLERPVTPVALLLGEAGSGKTAIVEEFAKRSNRGDFGESSSHFMPVALRLGELSALPRNELQAALAGILPALAGFERDARRVLRDSSLRLVLFIDEAHMMVTIFGAGTKIGGDVMKDMLARCPIPVVAATTRREYDSTIAVDKPLAERFKTIEIREVGSDTVREIALNWWDAVAPDCPPVPPETVRAIIEANLVYRPDSAEPRKTLDVMEDMVSVCRRTGRQATVDDVARVFHDRFSIVLGFNIDATSVFESIRSRIVGQPAALEVWDLLLHATAFKVEQNADKPRFTALLTGPTGVGKTESVKAIAETLYPGEKVIQHLNMPDFALDEAEPLFRKQLGETLRHTPNSIVLLDEFEKAAQPIKMSMLQILDEGIVNFTVLNREGREEAARASLRDAIVIATTNAGADVFGDDQRYGRTQGSDSEEYGLAQRVQVERLLQTLRENLIKNGFPAEMLGRFDQIIPYRALDEATTLEILDRKLMSLADGMARQHGIALDVHGPVEWSRDQYDCRARDAVVWIAYVRADIRNSNSGGARALMREVDTTVFYELVRAIRANPGCTRFELRVPSARARRDADGSESWRLDLEDKRGIEAVPAEGGGR